MHNLIILDAQITFHLIVDGHIFKMTEQSIDELTFVTFNVQHFYTVKASGSQHFNLRQLSGNGLTKLKKN